MGDEVSMKLVKVNDTGSKTYITVEAEGNEKIVIVADGSKIVELKGTNLLIKDRMKEEDGKEIL